eukprot:TRINITY_DN59523_c0_g1_i1.p1 TRINITY_DN59523_c0_g1~~TRINITY_DN59523_c0_g1_i1.p1  ORF type:complete len:235 (-),score=27.92 TRINITY_DN59523_c0_g1_i1:330-986(-)
MAASISLGLLEQSRKVAWADVELEFEGDAVEDCNHQVMSSAASCESSATSKNCSRNSRTRRSRRKSQGESMVPAQQKQKPVEPLHPTPTASRPVSRNVVTWSDLMDCGHSSPSASTATSSPIPSPPLSARMPCYVAATDRRSNPLVILPFASSSYRSTGYFPAAGNTRSGTQPNSSTSGSCVSSPSFCQGFPVPRAALPTAHQLEELLQLAAQTPYED